MSEDKSKNILKDVADGVSTCSTEEIAPIEAMTRIVIDDLDSSPEATTQDAKIGEAIKDAKCEISSSSVSESSPVEGAVGYSRRRSSSSESAVTELNRVAQSLDHCILESGKLHVFQRYFHEPKMTFFTKPQARRRHYAGGNQRRASEPTDATGLQLKSEGQTEDPLGYVRSYDPPRKPTINQAGAVIGYPERMPTAQEILQSKNDIVLCDRPNNSNRSLGSASTCPIDEVYAGNFTPVSHRDASDIASSAGISDFKVSSDEMSPLPLDLLPGAYRMSPPDEDVAAQWDKVQTRQRKLGLSDPFDIPRRLGGSERGSYGSCPDNYHKSVSRKSSLEFAPYVSTYWGGGAVAQRKISKDSSTDSSRQRSLSTESSVDLDIYMTSNLLTDIDDSTVRLIQESPSPGSVHSPPMPASVPIDPSSDFEASTLELNETLSEKGESEHGQA